MKKHIFLKAFTFIAMISLLQVVSACGSGEPSSGSSSPPAAGAPPASSEAPSAPAEVDLNFAIGATGGSNYPIGVAITQLLNDAQLPGLGNITTQPGGGAANIEGVHNNQIQMGIVFSTMVYDGNKGNPPFKEVSSNAVPLFSLHPYKLTVLVPADSDIQSFADLKGNRVNVGPNGFSSAVIAKQLFDLQGFKDGDLEILNLGVTDAVEQFKDGHVDALFYPPTDWYGPYIELAQSTNIRQVPIGSDLLNQLNEVNPGWVQAPWPLNDQIYKGLTPVDTLAQTNVIVVNPEAVSEELAYQMVKTIAENFEKIQSLEQSLELLEPSDLASYPGGDFHPGAEKYFKEQGWMQ